MSDSFDFNNIKYVSSKSRMTVRTKRKLDELAAQVAIWNQDSFYKRRNSATANKSKKMNSKSSRLTIDGKSKPFFPNLNLTSPVKSDILNNKAVPNVIRGSVKNKAAFFESLVTPQKNEINNKSKFTPHSAFIQKSILTENVFTYKLKNNENIDSSSNKSIDNNIDSVDKENIIDPQSEAEEEESLPPPPSDVSIEYLNDEEQSTTSSLSIINKDKSINSTIVTEYDYSSCSTVDLTRVSPLERSMSLVQDIKEELLKKNYVSETESVEQGTVESVGEQQTEVRKVRRSLSWSDKMHYIEPLQLDNEEEEEEEEEEEDTEEEEGDSIKNYDDSLVMIKIEERNVARSAKECMEQLQRVLNDPRNYLAGKEHITACLKLVKTCLIQKSIAERVKCHKDVQSAIEGLLDIQSIQLKIKDGFVFIDHENLENCNRGDDLQKLKKLFHIVLTVRSRGDPQIKTSVVYSIVHKSEAQRLSLPHEPLQWLEMYEYVRFNNLQPEFKFIFDLYCMKATPKKYKSAKTANNATPLRKLLRHCRSTEQVGSPSPGDRSLFFTNIGSFSVTASGLQPSRGLQSNGAELRVPSDCPVAGQAVFSTQFSMALSQECRGRLNVYSEVAEVGSWAFFDCHLTTTSLCGWLSGSADRRNTDGADRKPDLVLPFHLCFGEAKLCNYTICAKHNSFSIILDPLSSLSGLPVNRRRSTDGRNKKRFLAEAESSEEAAHWCRSINLVRQSFVCWTHALGAPL